MPVFRTMGETAPKSGLASRRATPRISGSGAGKEQDMEEVLYSLAYFSRNNIEATGGDLRTEVASILASARRYNEQFGITGALLFTQGCFVQVIEGPANSVKKAFERIKGDTRHRDISVLHYQPLSRRTFASWSMAFAGSLAPDAPRLHIDGILEGSEMRDNARTGQDLVVILRELIYDQEAQVSIAPVVGIPANTLESQVRR